MNVLTKNSQIKNKNGKNSSSSTFEHFNVKKLVDQIALHVK